ncbi:MAG TPA: MarP family serine protease [Magnetospirillaceae bacterium]|nr:MarP family serine protease [Magnetospirillaceae bacterium]
MNLVDVFIVALLVLTTQLGMNVGLARQLGITAGLFIGLFAAAYTQWQLITLMAGWGSHTSQLYVWLFAIVALILVLFIDVGLTIGSWLHETLEKIKRTAIVDSIGGAITAGITTIIAVWLGSTLILRGPNSFFAGQVGGSFIINSLKQTFPQAPELFAQAGSLLDPHALPRVFAGSEPTVTASNPSSDMTQELRQTASAVAPSVVKVTGIGCGGTSTGSGFVIADNTVITNAHVISGVPTPYVVDQKGQHTTETILFDPRLDIAILRTSELAGKPLPLHTEFVNKGTTGTTLGFASGELIASNSTVVGRQNATGYDIYDAKPVSRTIYTLNAIINQGDSGGPVINNQGEVIGVVFAKSSTTDNVGFALTADQIDVRLKTALAENQTVSNGQCGKE